MKTMSLIVSILTLSSAMGYGMDPTSLYELRRTGLIPVTDTNLDSLPQDAFLEINYCLKDMQSINAIRCVNRSCNKNAPSQAELNENFIRAVPKRYKDFMDDKSSVLAHLKYWERCGAHPVKVFLNFLENGNNNFALFIYNQCGLNNNNVLELAAKQGNIKVTKLLIADYHADDINRALTTAVVHGHKDLATMLIQNHQTNFVCIHLTAAREGNLHLFNLLIDYNMKLYDLLNEETKHKLPLDLLEKAVTCCHHSDLENCGHKDVIDLLISRYQLRAEDIQKTIIAKPLLSRYDLPSPQIGIVKWITTQYRKNFDAPSIRLAITQAKKRHYPEFILVLEEILAQMTNSNG